MSSSGLLLIAVTLFAACSAQQRIPRPLSDLEQQEMLQLHNDKRSRQPHQVNLECFMSTNKAMAAYAQQLADRCGADLPQDSPYGLGYFSVYGDVKGLHEYVNEASVNGHAFFDASKNNCMTIDQTQCDLFKQVFWFEADELGCGRSLCDGRTVVVCAYTYKNRKNFIPYYQVAEPYWRPCTACKPNKNVCMKNLCCSLEKAQPKENRRPEILIGLSRFWHAATGRNYLVTDSTETKQLLSMMNTNYYGQIGELAPQTNGDCALAKPVYRMYHEPQNSEFLTINTTVRRQALQRGYRDLGIIGFAVARKNECEATIPLYAFVKKSGETIQLEEGDDSEAMLADYMYDPKGISFWMWTSQGE